MDWSNESYVRLYTRDTPEWLDLEWQGRATFYELLRKVDRAGVLDLGKSGVRGLARALNMPREVVEAGLAELVRDRCVIQRGSSLVIPNFLEAQECAMSDKQRKRESRERRRALAMSESQYVTSGSENVTNESGIVPKESQPVTNGHGASQSVTLDSSVLDSALPNSENTHNAGAQAHTGARETPGRQDAFNGPTTTGNGSPAMADPKSHPSPQGGPALTAASPEGQAVLDAMVAHPGLAEEATGAIADALWGLAMAKSPLAWVVAAVHAVGAEADLAKAAHKPWSSDHARRQLRVFVSNAKDPKVAPNGRRRPDEVRQGQWKPPSAEERRRIEERNRQTLGPSMTAEEREKLMEEYS
jgi:hypothetical protein